MRNAIAGILGGLVLALTGYAQESKLNVFIWSEYIDEEIVKDFEKQFKCDVTLDLYEDNESMMAKLQGGGDAIYDICVPSDYIIPALIKRGLLAPLRKENVPNAKNVKAKFLNPPYDVGNKYSLPYQWGTVGIYIRLAEGEKVDPTWGLFFDKAKQPGPFLLIDSMRECFSAALNYKGHSINSTDPKELKEARDLLIDAKKRSLGFEGGVGGKNRVLAKGCKMAIVYNGDAIRGTGEDAETHYFVPKEGGQVWMDNMCIPAKAPNRDLAEKFINFILDPKVGARLSNFNQYATPNEASMPFIKKEDLENPGIYPPDDLMAKLEFLKDLGADTKIYDEIWTQIKSK
jgi:spermidine/putrescine transport system substrate-binding protein